MSVMMKLFIEALNSIALALVPKSVLLLPFSNQKDPFFAVSEGPYRWLDNDFDLPFFSGLCRIF